MVFHFVTARILVAEANVNPWCELALMYVCIGWEAQRTAMQQDPPAVAAFFLTLENFVNLRTNKIRNVRDSIDSEI